MYSKLAFSITAVLETDIILIDEVLSVGDSRFKRKSYRKMKELISDQDRTVVIVSHDMKTVADLCTKVLWINDGEFVRYGDTDEVLAEYDQSMAEQFPETHTNTTQFHADITGTGLSYQWQYRVSEDASWRLSVSPGNQSPTLYVPTTPGRDGYQFRCIVTDPSGSVQSSEIQTMCVPQPESE